MKDKRFRFAAVRSLAVQIVGGAAGIIAAYAGAGIYALTINPVFSSVMLFAINYREYPVRLRMKPAREALSKVFSFSAYQFSFQLLNFFSRNLDKLLMGRYMSLSDLGYYDKSYRLMMMPLQNIAFVISPVMHPVFAQMQHDIKKLGEAYLKVIRLLAFIGLPLSAVLWFTAEELVLIIFGDQWRPPTPRGCSLSADSSRRRSTSRPSRRASSPSERSKPWHGPSASRSPSTSCSVTMRCSVSPCG